MLQRDPTPLLPRRPRFEELLRFEPPSPVNGRWTTREVELHSTVIPKDAKVLLLTGSAATDAASVSVGEIRSAEALPELLSDVDTG